MNKNTIAESLLVGGILAIAGGMMDAYTYIMRGGVFANAQTGNIVLLGTNLFDGNIKKSGTYLVPIICFIVGIFLAEIIKAHHKKGLIHWKQKILLLEVAIVLVVSFLPRGDLDLLSNAMISFVCSLQVEAFRDMNGLKFATTMCTGNLRSGTELLFKGEISKAASYYIIVSLFILGAFLGALTSNIIGIHAALFPALLQIAVFIIIFKDNKR